MCEWHSEFNSLFFFYGNILHWDAVDVQRICHMNVCKWFIIVKVYSGVVFCNETFIQHFLGEGSMFSNMEKALKVEGFAVSSECDTFVKLSCKMEKENVYSRSNLNDNRNEFSLQTLTIHPLSVLLLSIAGRWCPCQLTSLSCDIREIKKKLKHV